MWKISKNPVDPNQYDLYNDTASMGHEYLYCFMTPVFVYCFIVGGWVFSLLGIILLVVVGILGMIFGTVARNWFPAICGLLFWLIVFGAFFWSIGVLRMIQFAIFGSTAEPPPP